MSGDMRGEPAGPSCPPVDFAALYDDHPEYMARRRVGSFEQAQIDIEVRLFKLPNLLGLLPPGQLPASVLEIGCATGELLEAFPVRDGGRKVGIDISAANVAVARARFPGIEFVSGDFRGGQFGATPPVPFDAVIMSDVLEHVPDDDAFLRDASALGRIVLVNLPLEDNWLNRSRHYGPDDLSGHLRRYSLADGLALVERGGLEVIGYARVWVHETPAEPARRALRRERLGAAFTGAWPSRTLRRAVFAIATAVPPLGRRLFSSNLFVAVRGRPAAPGAERPVP
ncbi:MAG: methyltransferase domain-containing protein [Bacteriovorax sp.]|nr:methyltransferase domain-containing protein [Rhizobacter sp.]